MRAVLETKRKVEISFAMIKGSIFLAANYVRKIRAGLAYYVRKVAQSDP